MPIDTQAASKADYTQAFSQCLLLVYYSAIDEEDCPAQPDRL
jgi:hypothetical protein